MVIIVLISQNRLVRRFTHNLVLLLLLLLLVFRFCSFESIDFRLESSDESCDGSIIKDRRSTFHDEDSISSAPIAAASLLVGSSPPPPPPPQLPPPPFSLSSLVCFSAPSLEATKSLGV